MKRIFYLLSAVLVLVAFPAEAANFIDYTLTGERETVPCVRNLPEPLDTFDAREHKECYVLVVLDQVSIGDTVQFEWFFEDNLYSSNEPYVFDEPSRYSVCVGEGLEIAGTEIENMTGEWSVKISVDGVYLINYRFYLDGLIPATTSTTTTQFTNGPCALALMYGEHSNETELLRFIRDNILSRTPEGRELIKVYYQFSPVIVQILTTDENFKEELKDMINEALPFLKISVEEPTINKN